MARKSVTYRQKAAKGDERRLENSNPEAAAEIAERVAEEPWLVISEMAYKLGLAPQTVQALIDRLKTRYQPVVAEIRKVTTKDLLGLMDERMRMALEYMTDGKMAEAGIKDLAIMFGILTEKRALLRGEPTQIIGTKERQNLTDLLPELLKEAQRRGMTVDLNPAEFGEVGDPAGRVIIDPARRIERAASRTIGGTK